MWHPLILRKKIIRLRLFFSKKERLGRDLFYVKKWCFLSLKWRVQEKNLFSSELIQKPEPKVSKVRFTKLQTSDIINVYFVVTLDSQKLAKKSKNWEMTPKICYEHKLYRKCQKDVTMITSCKVDWRSRIEDNKKCASKGTRLTPSSEISKITSTNERTWFGICLTICGNNNGANSDI